MTLGTKLGISTPFDSQHTFVTSPFFSTLTLAIIRLSLASYTLFTIIFVLAHETREHTDTYFSYFTHLSLIGLCTYLFAAGVQTIVYAHGKRKGYPLQRWPKVLQFLHVLLHSTIITYPILVTIVFFALLADKTTFSTAYFAWSNTSQHILNTVFALFEILCTRTEPSPWLHLPILIIILLGYLGIAYITHATQGFYTYSFLNPAKEHGKLAAYIAGIAVGEAVIFLFIRRVILVRERVAAKYVGRKPTERMEDWEDMERPKTPMVS